MSIAHQTPHTYHSTGYHVTIPQNITNQLPTRTNHRVALSTITTRNTPSELKNTNLPTKRYTYLTNPLDLHNIKYSQLPTIKMQKVQELQLTKTRPKGPSYNQEDYRQSIKEHLQAHPSKTPYITELQLTKARPKGPLCPPYTKEPQPTITSQKYGINTPSTIPPESKTHPPQQIPLYPITYQIMDNLARSVTFLKI